MATTYERVVEVLKNQDGVDLDEITPEMHLADLGLDSLAVVEILMDCEDEFGVTIDPEGDLSGMTIGEFAAFIEKSMEA